MYTQVYKPKNFDELSFNNNLTNKLVKLSEKNISQNILFYGPRNSGKKTRAYCLLAKLFNNSVFNPKINTFTLNKNLDIMYKASNYHIEISPSTYGINDKNIILKFIYDHASSNNIITNSHKYFVITNADNLSYKAQNILQSIIEKTCLTSRYILICNDLTRIIKSLRYKLLLLRNSLPSKKDISGILRNIAKKENIRTSTRAINIIIDSSKNYDNIIDLKYSINIFQMSYINAKYSRYDNNIITSNMEKMLKLINMEFNPNIIQKIREVLYTLYTNNINVILIIKYIINNLKDKNILDKAAYYENLMRHGNKNILCLEALVLNIIKMRLT